MNDFTLFHRRGMTTTAVLEACSRSSSTCSMTRASTSGRLMNLGLHPHVAGHPYRIRALREFLQYAKSHDDVWWATREEIAAWYFENHESHIPSTSA